MSALKRCLLLNVLVVITATVGPFGLAAPATSVPRATPPAHRAPQVKGKLSKASPLNRQPRFITPAYIRMYHPEVILRIAAQVQAGKARISDLNGLVSPYLANYLVKANLKPLNDRVMAKAPAGASTGSLADGLPAPEGSAITYDDIETAGGGPMIGGSGGGVSRGDSGGAGLTLPPADYSPHSVAQGPLRVNQVSWVPVTFTNPVTGSVTASLDNTYGGAAQVSSLDSYTGLMQRQANGSLEPIIDQQVNGGASLDAKAGQDCAVSVRLQFPKAGDYSFHLTVHGSAPWSVTVPIKVKVTQMGTSGAVAEADDADVTVIAGETGDLPITVKPIKFKNAFDVTISAKKLPKGITMDDVTVHVDRSGSVKAVLHVKADSSAVRYRAEQMDFNVAFGGEKTTLKSDVTVVPATCVYEFADCSSGSYTWSNCMFSCCADGSWNMGGKFNNSDTWFSPDCSAGVFYPSSMTTCAGNNFGVTLGQDISVNWGGNSGTSSWFQSHWATVLKSPPVAWLYNGDLNNAANGDVEIPTTPVITITDLW